MTAKPIKPVRYAIYTRKSTEHGLKLEFNSLTMQPITGNADDPSEKIEIPWQAPVSDLRC